MQYLYVLMCLVTSLAFEQDHGSHVLLPILSHSLGTGLLIVMFNPLFKIADAHLPAPVILFTTFGGLRGAVSLILAQMLVTQQDRLQKSGDMLQTAQVTCPTELGHVAYLTILLIMI